MLLEPIYEQEFYDFSFGFRRGRSAHDALETRAEGLWSMGGGWITDMDIRCFFDTLDHGKLRGMLRQRVVDGVVVRLIGKWLHAVLEEGRLFQEMRRVRHSSIQEQSRILGAKLRGFYAYYGVRGNSRSLSAFLHETRARWKKWLSRRSHKAWVTWEAFDRTVAQYPLPRPRMRSRQLRLANL